MTAVQFRDLKIGDSFDWINPAKPTQNSFYDYCVKTGKRTYDDEKGRTHRVGTINAAVFNVVRQDA